MSNRERLKIIAEDTLACIKQGYYTNTKGEQISIQDEMKTCQENTLFYKSEELESLLSQRNTKEPISTTIEVTNETTLAAGERLSKTFDKVLCLNFASAKHPGGGFAEGSSAQEESLARSSGLFASLIMKLDMYDRKIQNGLYHDDMIYSPHVPVFKNDNGSYLDEPYFLSFVTSPAVNKGALQKQLPNLSQQLIDNTMKKRIRKILSIALHHEYDALILGAYGCGVFKNRASDVANYFKEVLSSPASQKLLKVTIRH